MKQTLNKTIPLYTALATSFLLLACNPLGGSGGGKSNSQRITVPSACENPYEVFSIRVGDINPANGAQVNISTPISLTFSHPADEASLRSALGLQIWNGSDYDLLDFTVNASQSTALIIPDDPHLQADSSYRLQLSTVGLAVQMAGCEAGQKTLLMYDASGSLTDNLEVDFVTEDGSGQVNLLPSVGGLVLEGDSNNDGVINMEEKSSTGIKVQLNDNAQEGGELLINGVELVITQQHIDDEFILYDASSGLEIIDGRNEVVVTDVNGERKRVEFAADLEAPDKPEITHATGSYGAVASKRFVSGDTTDDTAPTLHGKAEAGGTVDLYSDCNATPSVDVVKKDIDVDANGQWLYTPAADLDIQPTPYAWCAYAYDKAGNKSLLGGEFRLSIVDEITVDSAITDVEFIGDANNDGVINKEEFDNGLSVKISLDCTSLSEGDVISVHVNGNLISHTLTQSDIASCALITVAIDDENYLIDGSNTITVKDPDPNSDAIDLEFEADLQIPAPPVILGADDRSGGIKGNAYSGAAIDEVQPVLRGTAEPNSVVWVFQGDSHLTESAAIPVDDDGKWSYTPAELQQGDYQWRATATDDALNTSDVNDAVPFSLKVLDPASKPVVANKNDALLGVIGADVAGLIQLEQQPLSAVDANEDITELTLKLKGGVLGLSLGAKFIYNEDLADKLGLAVESNAKPLLGLLGIELGVREMTLAVTPKQGDVLNNLLLNEFLATVYGDQGLLNLGLLEGGLSFVAKDLRNNEVDQANSSLLDLGLLSNLLRGSQTPDYIHFVGPNGNLDLSSVSNEQRAYVVDGGNNSITTGAGNTIVRAGDGNDTIITGAGNNLIDGGKGATTLTSGAGIDTVVFRLLDDSHPAGGNGVVTWQNFNNDIIDVRELLPDAAHRNNIENYLSIDSNQLLIDRDGGAGVFTSQPIITFDGNTPTLEGLMTSQQLRF